MSETNPRHIYSTHFWNERPQRESLHVQNDVERATVEPRLPPRQPRTKRQWARVFAIYPFRTPSDPDLDPSTSKRPVGSRSARLFELCFPAPQLNIVCRLFLYTKPEVLVPNIRKRQDLVFGPEKSTSGPVDAQSALFA